MKDLLTQSIKAQERQERRILKLLQETQLLKSALELAVKSVNDVLRTRDEDFWLNKGFGDFRMFWTAEVFKTMANNNTILDDKTIQEVYGEAFEYPTNCGRDTR